VLDINLMEVVHGIHTFLPHIRAHGEGSHIVNTASMAGMNSGLRFSPYSASKFAVVNILEGLAARLKPLGIGVTVFSINAPKCPFHHFQQDGQMAFGNPKGRAYYEPNSWGGAVGGPREAPDKSFTSFPSREQGAKRRGRS
jgi:NAD(P)-dependent dehydrogenase (short-subunit alcohol dehydrogenase family)